MAGCLMGRNKRKTREKNSETSQTGLIISGKTFRSFPNRFPTPKRELSQIRFDALKRWGNSCRLRQIKRKTCLQKFPRTSSYSIGKKSHVLNAMHTGLHNLLQGRLRSNRSREISGSQPARQQRNHLGRTQSASECLSGNGVCEEFCRSISVGSVAEDGVVGSFVEGDLRKEQNTSRCDIVRAHPLRDPSESL